MEVAPRERLRSVLPAVRIGLALVVVAWLFGFFGLRSVVPVWLAFLVALALEVHFFLDAPSRPAPRPDRLPQPVDLERHGFAEPADDLLVVRHGDDELWIPYAGETGEELDELIAEAVERADDEELEPEPALWETERRPLRQLLTGLAVIGVLAAVVWVADRGRGWEGLDAETRAEAGRLFSAEAARIAGHRVSIRCDESGNFVGAVQHSDGVATIGGRLAYLAPERCLDLYRLAFDDEVTFSQTARSIRVLAHEAWHLRGVRDEGTVECYAIQSGVELGQRLGLSEGTARRMMRQQLAENALRAGGSAEYRIPPECRDGGDLDLNLSSRFP